MHEVAQPVIWQPAARLTGTTGRSPANLARLDANGVASPKSRTTPGLYQAVKRRKASV